MAAVLKRTRGRRLQVAAATVTNHLRARP
jgi:hypothetical protein